MASHGFWKISEEDKTARSYLLALLGVFIWLARNELVFSEIQPNMKKSF
jgi:hypothetical protein